MVEGTKVRLVQAHHPGLVDDEGVVTDAQDPASLGVRITHRAGCTPVTVVLVAVPPHKLSTDTRCI